MTIESLPDGASKAWNYFRLFFYQLDKPRTFWKKVRGKEKKLKPDWLKLGFATKNSE